MSKTKSDEYPYEALLRAVGEYLDDRGARYATVVEAPDGFAVRYQHTLQGSTPELVYFNFEDVQLRRERFVSRLVHRGHLVGHGARYSDLFRALGHELDEAHGHSVLLEDLDDGLILTYLYDDPGNGFILRKHRAMLSHEEREALCKRAEARGGRDKKEGWVVTARWKPSTRGPWSDTTRPKEPVTRR